MAWAAARGDPRAELVIQTSGLGFPRETKKAIPLRFVKETARAVMGSMSRRDLSPPPESDVTVAQLSLEKVRKVGQSHKGCISIPPFSSQLTEA